MTININDNSAPVHALLAGLAGLALIYAQANLSTLFSLLACVPFVVVWCSYGPAWSILSLLTAGAGSMLFLEPGQMVGVLPQILVVSVSLGILISKKASLFTEMTLTTLLAVLVSLVSLFLIARVEEINLMEELASGVTEVVRSIFEQIKNASIWEDTALSAEEEELATLMGRQISLLLPTILFVAQLFASLVNMGLSHQLLKNQDVPVRNFALSQIQMPKALGFLAIVLFLVNIFLGQQVNELIQAGITNILYIMLVLLTVNGIAASSRFLEKRVSQHIRILLLATLVLFFSPALIFFLIIGVIDVFRNQEPNATAS